MSLFTKIQDVLDERTSRLDFLPSWTEEELTKVLNNAPKYLRHCYALAAARSHDPSTQVGAILVNSKGIPIGSGCNQFPIGYNSDNSVEEHRCSDSSIDKETKYAFMEHAERNAIYAAFRHADGMHSFHNPIMFCPFFSCIECSRAIIQSGIQLVIGHKKVMSITPNRWSYSISEGRKLFDSAGVHYMEMECDISDAMANIMFDGKLFSP